MNDIWMNNPIPDARYLKFKVSAVKQLFLHDMERLIIEISTSIQVYTHLIVLNVL